MPALSYTHSPRLKEKTGGPAARATTVLEVGSISPSYLGANQPGYARLFFTRSFLCGDAAVMPESMRAAII